jgi:hypothetical protein
VGTAGEEGPGPKVGSLGVHGVPLSPHCQPRREQFAVLCGDCACSAIPLLGRTMGPSVVYTQA